ncbi:MAG: hypothetical protein NTW96_27720, partial [Planctomycetia bacterium]|nr:hypothetical protein [Planctomycetia bacterium]
MQAIDRVGTFRGRVTEHAVNTTKNGFPQLVGRFLAEEMWDSDSKTWMPWSEYQQELVGYLTLFNADGPLLNAGQCRAAFGWDGASLAELNDLDLSNLVIQFRIEEDDYKGTVTLRVNWIDQADANPDRGIKKLDAASLKDLDGKFGLGKKVAPAKAPGKPAAPPKKAPPAKAADPTPTPAATPAAPPKAPGKKSAPKAEAPKVETMTKEEAWESVSKLKRDDVSDDQMLAAWMGACCRIQGIEVGEDIQ